MDRRRFVKSVGCAGTLAAATQLPAGASCMDEMMRLSQNRPSAVGMGFVVLDKDKTFAEQVTQENTIYEIRYDFDLGGLPKEIPAGCVLKFEGGSLRNGTIVCAEGCIHSDNKCFYEVFVHGSWNNPSELSWWCESSKIQISSSGNSFSITKIDCSDDFQYALDSDFSELHINGYYYITKTQILRKYKRLVLSGLPVTYSFAYNGKDSMLSSFVFSDKDITLLRIAPESHSEYANNQVSIEGGNFDVSRVSGYSSNCIEVDIRENRKIWGLNIDTGINGNQTAYAPATGCGINFITDNGNGYATMVRIKGSIMWFGTGIHVYDALPCWISDVEVNSAITNCVCAIDAKTDIYINASIQPYTAFTEDKKRDVPLINIAGGRAVVGGMIWDLGARLSDGNGTDYYANDVAIHIGEKAKVSVVGKIKQLGYDYDSFHVTGNKSPLRTIDWTMGDKYNVAPEMVHNYMESFTDKGGKCSITLKNGVGQDIPGMTVENIDNVFKIASSPVKIALDSYNSADGRYIEVKLSNINKIISYIGFSVASRPVTGFGRYSFDINFVEASARPFHLEDYVYPDNYAKLLLLDKKLVRAYAVSEIIIRLYEISDVIFLHKIIANVLVGQYQTYTPAFLPISGGTVYGHTAFKNLQIPNGNGSARPVGVNVGEMYFDTTLSKPIWWNGTEWVDATGTTVG